MILDLMRSFGADISTCRRKQPLSSPPTANPATARARVSAPMPLVAKHARDDAISSASEAFVAGLLPFASPTAPQQISPSMLPTKKMELAAVISAVVRDGQSFRSLG